MLIPKSAQLEINSGGTQEQFTSTSELIPAGRAVHVQTNSSNTGPVYLGDKDVTATTGHILDPDDPPLELVYDEPWDISTLWADTTHNGNKVSIFWMGEA